MNFTEKYASFSEKDKPENKDKKIISDDFYAVGEVLDELIQKMERLRVSLL